MNLNWKGYKYLYGRKWFVWNSNKFVMKILETFIDIILFKNCEY